MLLSIRIECVIISKDVYSLVISLPWAFLSCNFRWADEIKKKNVTKFLLGHVTSKLLPEMLVGVRCNFKSLLVGRGVHTNNYFPEKFQPFNK